MKILVINCGSSSLKYQVLEMETETLLCKGFVERIGLDGSVLKHEKADMEPVVLQAPMNDHKEAIAHVMDAIVHPEHGVASSMKEIGAVGHRVVHAGEKYAWSVLLTDDVIHALEDCVSLAPLHNPPNLLGIAACRELMPTTPMVGVFDTAFHQSMPEEYYIYAIPYEYYTKYGVRRYGFHGTSHRYVSERAAAMLGKEIADTKVITCHLGNGASITAIDGGKVLDTSMGFTPLEGLVMGTRCGDIDPAIIDFISQKEDLTIREVNDILNKKSGVLGISGVSSDFRDIEAAAAKGNARAALALKVYANKVKFYIGGYMAELNGADAIVFTAGLGENGVLMRNMICKDLTNLGILLSPERNEIRGREAVLSTDDSPVSILLIPTNEELMIAKDTYQIVTE
jgi:acetate kinase